ncbi:YaaR family protein [Priestia megaterium]|uniref:YaaR family protein n=1 Tax=Priestia megaterium TaxID=1404 RepID=UPI002E1F2CD8|nr:YaaR family protein [Priestia megaterium]MED4291770.1 YaaR family protein [Priestia megaterium]MED4295772.1 YaaR family protein [Priestia megaterium]
MEVQRINSLSSSMNLIREKEVSGSVSFTGVMAKKQKELTYEHLTQVINKIEEQGKQLVKSQTIDSLRKYKTLVKQFMNEVVKNGFELHEERGFNHRETTKVYKLVKEVDTKLVDLTNDILQKEKDSLNLLKRVGEIQGLLINMYT